MQSLPQSIDAVETLLSGEGYVASRALATVVFLSLKLGRPLFLEGEAGVGKTEIAKVLAQALGRRLIRLQCYEGLDAASAVCEWNFAAQMIAIRTAEAGGGADRDALKAELFTEEYLIERPLRGLSAGGFVGFSGDDPGTGHHQGPRAAHRDRDVEPHARGA